YRRRQTMHLDAMLALCETVECRRVQLLNYFGQSAEPCGNCDTCLTPPESWDATVPAQKVLSVIVRLERERRQKFGAGHIIDILLGKKNAKVIQFDHDSLKSFGVGTELREAEWRGVVRQLLAQGLVAVESNHGTLVQTEQSAAVLRGERRVMMRREPERPAPKAAKAARERKAPAELPAEAAPVFERLRAWRAATAKEQGVPAYVIFHDATLREIATALPTTLAELARVNGVGETKLAKYGDQVLETLASAGGPRPRRAAGRGSGSRSPRGLAGGAAAGFDGAVDVAGPAGGGLGARPVQRPDGPAERRAEAGEGPG